MVRERNHGKESIYLYPGMLTTNPDPMDQGLTPEMVKESYRTEELRSKMELKNRSGGNKPLAGMVY